MNMRCCYRFDASNGLLGEMWKMMIRINEAIGQTPISPPKSLITTIGGGELLFLHTGSFLLPRTINDQPWLLTPDNFAAVNN